MTKTRSYGDLPNASDVCPNAFRRSSDPSITVDSMSVSPFLLYIITILIFSISNFSSINSLTVTDKTENDSESVGEPPNSSEPANRRDFLSNDLDEIDCNSDCIYKDEEEDCDVVPAEGETTEFPPEPEKTELVKDIFECDKQKTSAIGGGTFLKEVGAFESICLRPTRSGGRIGGDINHNGDGFKGSGEEPDSDTECTTEPSESRSEHTIVCEGSGGAFGSREGIAVDVLKSVETSTETLVSENVVCG